MSTQCLNIFCMIDLDENVEWKQHFYVISLSPFFIFIWKWCTYRHVRVCMINENKLGLLAVDAQTHNFLNVVLCEKKKKREEKMNLLLNISGEMVYTVTLCIIVPK